MPGGRGGDSDSDSELDIEGGPPSPDGGDLNAEENNNGRDSGRDGPESGSEDDPLTKTSPPTSGGGGLSSHTSWPSHPAFAAMAQHSHPSIGGLYHPASGLSSPVSAHQTLSKITSQFWGFDDGLPPGSGGNALAAGLGRLGSGLLPPLGGHHPGLDPHSHLHHHHPLSSLAFPLAFPGLMGAGSGLFKLPGLAGAEGGGAATDPRPLFRFKSS